MVEVRDVLRGWLEGAGLRTVAQRLGVDPASRARTPGGDCAVIIGEPSALTAGAVLGGVCSCLSSTRSPIRTGRSTSDYYYGCADSKLIEKDFTREERRDFTIRKEILWEWQTATPSELTRVEIEFIRSLGSNDPAVGYNQCPRLVGR